MSDVMFVVIVYHFSVKRLPVDDYFRTRCPVCLEDNIRKVNILCLCDNDRHCENCTIIVYCGIYFNAPWDRLVVVVDNLLNGPVYGPYIDLGGIDQHQRDTMHYHNIRGNTLVPNEETVAQMVGTFSTKTLRNLMEEIDDAGNDMRNLAGLAREYSPNEAMYEIPYRYTARFDRSFDDVMEDVVRADA